MRVIIFILLFFLCFSPDVIIHAQDDGEGKLLKIVALSRHGVRAPTQSHKVLHSWSQKPWPVWPVKKGDLTQRGASLVTAMWKNFHSILAEKGIIPENTCPKPDSIYIRADSDERTRATAYAMIQGLGPGCSLSYAVLNEKIDPLFHPVKAGLFHFSPAQTATDIMTETHGGLGALQERFSRQLDLMESITGSPSPQVCARFSFSADCSLSDLPNAISVSSDGTDVKLVGAMSIASDIAEIFLLEYGEWPGEAAGWGMVNNRILKELLPIHTTIFDVVNRTPQIAWARGGFLLSEMTQALQGKHSDQKVNDAKLVIFVGHDTNIANIGGLLGLNWKMEEYPENGIPPASVLWFELWSKGNKREVKINYYTQSMEALNSIINKSGENLKTFQPVPASVTVLPGTGEDVYDFESFIAKAEKAFKDAPATNEAAKNLVYSTSMPRE